MGNAMTKRSPETFRAAVYACKAIARFSGVWLQAVISLQASQHFKSKAPIITHA